jgi:hypothetical protein
MSLHPSKTRRTLATARAPPTRAILPETPLRGGTFRIDHSFKFVDNLNTVPIRTNRFHESAVSARRGEKTCF